MPRELIAIAPRTPILREYEDASLGPRQIRVRTEFASPKHGTELIAYRNDPAVNRPYDPAWGAVMPKGSEGGRKGAKGGEEERRFEEDEAASSLRSVQSSSAPFIPPLPPSSPLILGNMSVGTVVEAGSEVTRFRVGDRVFGHFPIRETQTVDETAADLLPEGLSPEAAVCLDPLVMALAMRDAGIKLGDRVAVFGLGAIGLFAVQLARAAGAAWVIAVDPLANRRALAQQFCADAVLDPTVEGDDVGLAIRRLTGPTPNLVTPRPEKRVTGGFWERPTQTSNLGVDVAVETSGSIPALHQAMRATRFGGTVCVLSYYGRDASGLYLGDEFHVNRLTLVSARAVSLPLVDAPAWDLQRLVDVALAWLVSGRVRTEGIVTPIVPFEESVEAYQAIDERPAESIKLGIRF
jgi:threonine dehydrogenase-like Zn-dependent dehydrogenase